MKTLKQYYDETQGCRPVIEINDIKVAAQEAGRAVSNLSSLCWHFVCQQGDKVAERELSTLQKELTGKSRSLLRRYKSAALKAYRECVKAGINPASFGNHTTALKRAMAVIEAKEAGDKPAPTKLKKAGKKADNKSASNNETKEADNKPASNNDVAALFAAFNTLSSQDKVRFYHTIEAHMRETGLI